MLDWYRGILAHNVDGAIVLDAEGRVLYANPAAERLFVKPSEALVGRRFGFPVITAESSEIELIQPGGALVAVEMRAAGLRLDDQDALLVSLRDITERRQVENALRQAELFNSAIINALQAAIAVLDAHGNIVRVNQTWMQLAAQQGTPHLLRADVGANYFDVCRQTSDSFADAALHGMQRVLAGEAAGFDLKYPCDGPQGKRWFVMRVKLAAAENLRGLIVAHIDATAHRAMRQAQHDAEAAERLRQRELEREAFQLLAYTPARDASGITPALHEELVRRYSRLLDLAVEQRAYKIDNQVSALSEELGYQLGRLAAHPRDLIQIHLEALNRKRRENVKAPARAQIYLEEGRVLVLEMMGYLASCYRKRALGAPDETLKNAAGDSQT
ncbi:MAG: PAS domain-containing protein [Aggregatilineales bacterium]